MNRRRYLALTGAGVAIPFSGCTGDTDTSSDSGFGENDGQRDPTQTTPSGEGGGGDTQPGETDPTDATADTPREQARQNIAATLVALADTSESLRVAGSQTRRAFSSGLSRIIRPNLPSYEQLRGTLSRSRSLLGEVNANGPTDLQPATTPLQAVINQQSSHLTYYETIASLMNTLAESPVPDQLVADLPTLSEQRATTIATQADELSRQYQTLITEQFETTAELAPQKDLYDALFEKYAPQTAVEDISAGSVRALSGVSHQVMTDFFSIVPALRRAILTFGDALTGLSEGQLSTSESLFQASDTHSSDVGAVVDQANSGRFPFPLAEGTSGAYTTDPTPYAGAVCVARNLPVSSESFRAVIRARRSGSPGEAEQRRLDARSAIEKCRVYLPFDGTEAI